MSRFIPALILFNLSIVLVHWPAVVDLTLRSGWAHFVAHAMLVLSAFIVWMPIVSPLPEIPRLQAPLRMAFLFLQSVVPTIPASFLTFGSHPLYRRYESLPKLWGITALDDQLIAGLIMKIGAGLLLWALIAVIFFRWAAAEERRNRPGPGTAGLGPGADRDGIAGLDGRRTRVDGDLRGTGAERAGSEGGVALAVAVGGGRSAGGARWARRRTRRSSSARSASGCRSCCPVGSILAVAFVRAQPVARLPRGVGGELRLRGARSPSGITLAILVGATLVAALPNLRTSSLDRGRRRWSLAVVLLVGSLVLGASLPKAEAGRGIRRAHGPGDQHARGRRAARRSAFQAKTFDVPAGINLIKYIDKGGTHTLVFDKNALPGFELRCRAARAREGRPEAEHDLHDLLHDPRPPRRPAWRRTSSSARPAARPRPARRPTRPPRCAGHADHHGAGGQGVAVEHGVLMRRSLKWATVVGGVARRCSAPRGGAAAVAAAARPTSSRRVRRSRR